MYVVGRVVHLVRAVWTYKTNFMTASLNSNGCVGSVKERESRIRVDGSDSGQGLWC